jgi:CheY-like chemotaxis protein
VKQSGGHVKIYSEVGHGTTVKLYLPRLKAKQALPPIQKPAELQQHLQQELTNAPLAVATVPVLPERKLNVLIVEDNDAVREVAAAMIEDMGFAVLSANSGPEGFKIIEANAAIDLVISDVIMAGGMNGPDLARKALKARPDLKFLFMSGYAPGSVRQMQDLPDTVDLVHKPFSRSDLTAKVMKALELPVAA